MMPPMRPKAAAQKQDGKFKFSWLGAKTDFEKWAQSRQMIHAQDKIKL